MIRLTNPDFYFIERTAFGPTHIASQIRFRNWRTLCGREWRADKVSELTRRELSDDDPDTFVCRACKSHLPADIAVDAPPARGDIVGG